jgi:tubulin monoglycylase TTLL3/8
MKLTILSAWGYIEWRPGSIGIYGFDIIIDSNLKCWLIEVNKCPCMAYSTHVTKTLIPLFMEDLAKVIVDKINDPNCDTGDLE